MKSFYPNLQPSPFYDDGRECLVEVKGSVLSLLGSGLLASKVAALCFEAKLVYFACFCFAVSLVVFSGFWFAGDCQCFSFQCVWLVVVVVFVILSLMCILRLRGVVVSALASHARGARFDSRPGVVTLGKFLYTHCLC